MDPRLPVVFSALTARHLGYTRDQVRQRVRAGRWIRLRRGCYCQAEHFTRLSADQDGRHILEIAAALVVAGRDAVAALWSAALLHGLPRPMGVSKTVSLVRPSGEVRRVAGLAIDVAALPAEHRDPREEALRATTPARTVVDLARRMPLIDAVMVADAALHRGLVTKAELRDVLALQAGWRGSGQAHGVIEFADSRSESPLESRSRVRMFEARLPPPEPQFCIHDEDGEVVARADFGWRDRRTIGEADGKTKYADGRAQTLYEEKRREDAIRRLRWEVVRWTSDEVEHRFPVVERRILAASASAAARGWTP